MPNFVLIPAFYVKLSGSEVSPEFMASLEAIEVDLSVYLPGMATLRMIDTKLKWVDESSLDIGAARNLSQTNGPDRRRRSAGGGRWFKGRIASLSPNTK